MLFLLCFIRIFEIVVGAPYYTDSVNLPSIGKVYVYSSKVYSGYCQQHFQRLRVTSWCNIVHPSINIVSKPCKSGSLPLLSRISAFLLTIFYCYINAVHHFPNDFQHFSLVSNSKYQRVDIRVGKGRQYAPNVCSWIKEIVCFPKRTWGRHWDLRGK